MARVGAAVPVEFPGVERGPVRHIAVRVALAVGWSAVQMAAVGAVALAISAFTEHPLVVVVATMSGLIVFEVTDEGVQRIELVAKEQAQRLFPLWSKRVRVAFERTDEGLVTLHWTESRGVDCSRSARRVSPRPWP